MLRGLLGLGTGIRVWRAVGAGRGVGFAFKLCQLTSEAFLSWASQSEPRELKQIHGATAASCPLCRHMAGEGWGQGNQSLGEASSTFASAKEPPRGSCEGEEEAEEQLFLLVGGFLAGHLLGNGGAEFPL